MDWPAAAQVGSAHPPVQVRQRPDAHQPFLARPRSFRGIFTPSSPTLGVSIGGSRPQLMFFLRLGTRYLPTSSPSMWPPVTWSTRAPRAVVGGGASSVLPRRSAAAKRPASRPVAALST